MEKNEFNDEGSLRQKPSKKGSASPLCGNL